MADLCDIRKDLNKVAAAEDALRRISRFGRLAILLDVIRPRLKELSRRVLLSWPDMASACTGRPKYQLTDITFFCYESGLGRDCGRVRCLFGVLSDHDACW